MSLSLMQQSKVYFEVRDNLGEGMRFYTSLQDAVGILKQQVMDFSMTRRVQRDDHLQVRGIGYYHCLKNPIKLVS